MANKTKQQLIVENNTNFPTNNAGAITADDLRNFNTDMIDSTVNQEVYTTDSQSFDSRIDQSIVTASLSGDILTFTKDNGSEFGVTITGATIPPGTISGSEQISGLGFVSSSITGSSIVTASAVDNVMTFTKGDSSTFSVVVGSVLPGGLVSGSSQIDYPQISNIPGGIVSSSAQVVGILDSVNTFTQSQQTYNGDNDTKWNTLGGQTGSFITESETGSFARTDVNNNFGGTQTFNDIVVNGTASIANINYVTGSATIIGDAYIVLNTDTPTLRYAGIIVTDSGSGGTASLEWDGDVDEWLVVDEQQNTAYLLYGPTGSKGAEIGLTTNRVVKSGVDNQIVDTNITDDGLNVSINSNTQITGSLSVNGNSVLVGSDLTALNNFTQSADSRLDNIELTTQSLQSQVDGLSNETSSYALSASVAAVDEAQQLQIDSLISVTGSFVTSSTDITSLNAFTASQIDLNGTFATTGSNTFVGNQFITGAILQSSSLLNEITKLQIAKSNKVDFSEADTLLSLVGDGAVGFDQYVDGGNFDTLNILITENQGTQFRDWNQVGYPSWLRIPTNTGNNPSPIFTRGLEITGSVNITGTLTASLQEGYVWVGDLNGRTTTVSTGSFATTSGNTFNGNQQITGSLSVSGSINNSVNTLTIASNTASIDASLGNTFQLNLVSGSNTRLEVSNVKSGQTLNLLVSQSNPFGGTLTLAENLLEPSGSEYSASLVNGAQDILTLASFVRTDVMYVANINNLI
jgi:hypothetical protein